MLNIELIRFEAQDVITASGVKEPVCTCAFGCGNYGPAGYGIYDETGFVPCKCEIDHPHKRP